MNLEKAYYKLGTPVLAISLVSALLCALTGQVWLLILAAASYLSFTLLSTYLAVTTYIGFSKTILEMINPTHEKETHNV